MASHGVNYKGSDVRTRIRECLAEYNARQPKGSDPLTQAGIGRSLGVSESLVSLWIGGQRPMKAQMALRLAELLGCEPRDLFAPSDSQAVNQSQRGAA